MLSKEKPKNIPNEVPILEDDFNDFDEWTPEGEGCPLPWLPGERDEFYHTLQQDADN